MKTIPILCASLLAYLPACSTVHRHKHKPDIIQVRNAEIPAGTTMPQGESESLRNAEVIKQYYASDYIDPNNPSVRHAAHNIQRVEQAASWNLRPSAPVVAGGPTYTAASAAAQTSALGAQLSGALDRQKGYADALAQQNEKLQEIIQELKAAKEQDTQAKAASADELKLTAETLKLLRKEIQNQPVARPFSPVYAPPAQPTLFDRLENPALEPPSHSSISPKVNDLLDVVDDHVAALENEKRAQPSPPEDIIPLDDISAPLVSAANGKE
jgi:hypothetical protein